MHGHPPRGDGMEDNANRERPSKTAQKRRMHELQALGERLAALNRAQIDSIELPDDLREALLELERIGGRESRRRQLQYIGRLMRDVDPAPIRDRLAEWDGLSYRHAARMHDVERWRDRLIADDSALDELIARRPGADRARLRALAHNARDERMAGRAPKNFRELFRALREILGARDETAD